MLKEKELYNLEKEIKYYEDKITYQTLQSIHIHDGQPDILAYIYMHKGCTQYEIAKALGLSRASVGISLKRMSKNGYIVVKESDVSKRSTCVYITELGTKTLVKADMLMSNFVSDKFRDFSDEEIEGYLYLLKKMEHNLVDAYRKTIQEDK